MKPLPHADKLYLPFRRSSPHSQALSPDLRHPDIALQEITVRDCVLAVTIGVGVAALGGFSLGAGALFGAGALAVLYVADTLMENTVGDLTRDIGRELDQLNGGNRLLALTGLTSRVTTQASPLSSVNLTAMPFDFFFLITNTNCSAFSYGVKFNGSVIYAHAVELPPGYALPCNRCVLCYLSLSCP